MLGKIEGGKRRGQRRMRWWDGITDSMDMNLCRLWELVMYRKALHAAVHESQIVEHDWETELNWTELIIILGKLQNSKFEQFLLKAYYFHTIVKLNHFKSHYCKLEGLPWWLSGKEPTCQCRSHGLDSWVRKIPWRRKWKPTPGFLPGKSHEQKSLVASMGSQRVGHDLATKQQ